LKVFYTTLHKIFKTSHKSSHFSCHMYTIRLNPLLQDGPGLIQLVKVKIIINHLQATGAKLTEFQ